MNWDTIAKLRSRFNELTLKVEETTKRLETAREKIANLSGKVVYAQQVMFDVTTEQVNQQRDVELQTMTMM